MACAQLRAGISLFFSSLYIPRHTRDVVHLPDTFWYAHYILNACITYLSIPPLPASSLRWTKNKSCGWLDPYLSPLATPTLCYACVGLGLSLTRKPTSATCTSSASLSQALLGTNFSVYTQINLLQRQTRKKMPGRKKARVPAGFWVFFLNLYLLAPSHVQRCPSEQATVFDFFTKQP